MGVRVNMDSTQKILLKRYLNKDGQAQIRFTKECAKEFNNYIPFKTGRLKDVMVTLQTKSITYSAPYAKRQYYTNLGKGRQGTDMGGLRGKYWDKRAWANKGDTIVQTIADFVGGKKK